MRKLWLFTLLTLGACSASVTSVDGDKKVDDLSPSDETQLCKDVAKFVADKLSGDEIARIACGFSAANGGTSCQADFEACVADAPSITLVADAADCGAFRQMIEGCDATVDEFATCIEQMVDALASLEDKVPFCSDEEAISAALALQNDVSSDCISLFETCSVGIQGQTSGGPR